MSEAYKPQVGDKVRVLVPKSRMGNSIDVTKPYFVYQEPSNDADGWGIVDTFFGYDEFFSVNALDIKPWGLE